MAKYDYLKWCIKVANADFAEDGNFQSLARDVLEKGWLSGWIDTIEESPELLRKMIMSEAVPIKENVIALATANTKGIDYVVELSLHYGHRRFEVNSLSPLAIQGMVKFLLKTPPNTEEYKKFMKALNQKSQEIDEVMENFKRLAGKEPTIDDQKQLENLQQSLKTLEEYNPAEPFKRVPGLTENLKLNEQVMKFYETIEKYCQDKNCKIDEVPIRLCKLDTCKRPFFGRLMNQQFCKKRHGEIWHAKQAYRKKILGR